MKNPTPLGPDIMSVTSPPTEDTSYLPPSVERTYDEFESLTDPETRSKLEAKMIQTFLKVMESPKSTSTNQLAAAKEIGELLGKYNQPSAPIIGENVQINQISEDPAKAQHLLDSLRNARGVAAATDPGTRPIKGGQGV